MVERREFIKKSTLAVGAAGMSGLLKGCEMGEAKKLIADNGEIPKRPYGKTGVELSMIGFGGIVVMDCEPEAASKVVAEAVNRGVNYFDVAPSYGDAEVKLGPALEPYRKNCFLACKTTCRDRASAQKEFNKSLEHLRTDYFDLYQLHALESVEKDVDAAFGRGGAMEFFTEAKKTGQVRFLGFSAHSEEAALAAMERYDFDSVLFPINFATFYKGNFGPKVIAKAKEKGMVILALKMLARQRWPENDPLRREYKKCWYQPVTDAAEAKLASCFTLSQPVTAAVSPGDERLFRMAMDLAVSFEPITEQQAGEVRKLASQMNPVFSSI